ncbi:MAG: hydroxymethylglutaryl-CoA lyase [Pseudobdellovibrionaceae bacterium]
MKNKIQIVEMGLRDGLQNEKVHLSTATRFELFKKICDSGLRRIEVGAFVSPQWVPQMSPTRELILESYEWLKKNKLEKKIQISALVPNLKGLEMALETPVKEVAIFASATESFAQKNTNCSIAESFERFKPVLALAKKKKIKVRGYLSVCFGCPFEGAVSEDKVVRLAVDLYKMGIYELSIGDTIGIANVGQVKSLFTKLKRKIPVTALAGHFHDTRGQALVNILMAYQMGVRVFDSSVGGLGGCPYAPNSSGNVATEEVAFMFDGMGVEHKVNTKNILTYSKWLAEQVQHPLSSRLAKADGQ